MDNVRVVDVAKAIVTMLDQCYVVLVAGVAYVAELETVTIDDLGAVHIVVVHVAAVA